MALHVNVLYRLSNPVIRVWRRRKTRQRIRASATSPIGEIERDGPAQIEDHARALETVLSPLSYTRAIGYRVRVELVFGGGENDPVHRRIIDIARFEAFEVDDGEQRALVRPGRPRPRLLAAGRRHSRGELLIRLGHPEFAHQLNLQESSVNEVAASQKVSCREHLLLPDGPVFVCGQARRELDPTGAARSYRESPSRVVVEPAPREAMLVADCRRAELLKTLSRRFDG